MTSPPTLPRQSWPHHIITVTALVTLLLGCALLLGQLAWLDGIFDAAGQNTGWPQAAGLGGALIAAGVLLTALTGRPTGASLAAGGCLIGLAELAANLNGMDSIVGRWLGGHMAAASFAAPQAMPAVVASALLLGGAAVFWLVLPAGRPTRSPAIAIECFHSL